MGIHMKAALDAIFIRGTKMVVVFTWLEGLSPSDNTFIILPDIT
jgi:hypothetical protein